MHSKTITSAALLGLSAIAAAAPASSDFQYTQDSTVDADGQEAFVFPLSDGFPNVTGDAVKAIETAALGSLSNAKPPAPGGASDESINELAFVAFNELFEVAFFTELIFNITNNKPGFTKDDINGDRDEILAVLEVHLADEELHVLNAEGAFGALTNGGVIEPCEYIFNVSNFGEAIQFVSTITDVVLSTLPDIQTQFGIAGDNGLIRGVGAVIGQEGEQNGFYRNLLGLPPASNPFLTQGAVDFAFNAIIQNNVVPGSCSQLFTFQNPVKGKGRTLFDSLVLQDPQDVKFGQDTVVTFEGINTIAANNITSIPSSVQSAPAASATANQLLAQAQTEGVYITYLNQVNVPFSESVNVTRGPNGNQIFTANFPAKSQFFSGLVIAAITNSSNFASPDDVAAATLFGPAIIEVTVSDKDIEGSGSGYSYNSTTIATSTYASATSAYASPSATSTGYGHGY